MTPEQLQEHWNRAQALEAGGALDEARATYGSILAASPRQLMVQLRLSALEQAAGRYRASRQHALDAAATLAQTGRWEGLPYVSAQLLAFEERRVAQRLILGADWSSAQVLSQAPALSQHLDLCGGEVDALRLIDASQRRSGPNHLLEYSRANALRDLGRLEEATAAYERCLALAPDYAYAHWSLAYHAPAGASRVPRIRAAFARQQDELRRAHLHYALFKELDAAGDIDAAWTELQGGMRLMRALQPYDAEGEEAAVAAVMARPIRPPAPARDARVPVFIVGMPRTGTTVLERILGGHPGVVDAGELNDFQHAASQASDRFVRLPPEVADLAALSGLDPQTIGRAYLERTSHHYGGRTHLVDKNPQNVFAAGLVAEALPQARILCLVREPADACFSNLKELFAPGAYAYSYAMEEVAGHHARFRRLVQHWRENLPGQFLVVPYEELVSSPEAVTTQVLEFCGLTPDPACVDISRNLSPSSTASSSQVREPIHARHVGAWRRYARHLEPMLEGLGQAG
jgi:tetratricopeptide (TPR) repeat protein